MTNLPFHKTPLWTTIKWISNIMAMIAAGSLLNPDIAAHNVYPWVLYTIANIVWFFDTKMDGNHSWMWMAVFYVSLNILILLSRVSPSFNVFNFLV